MAWRIWWPALISVIACVAVLSACGDDSVDGDDGGNTGTPTPTVADGEGGGDGDDGGDGAGEENAACDLLSEVDLEALFDTVFSLQPGPADDFVSCNGFVGGGQIVLEMCEGCRSAAEFTDEVERVARGRETTAERLSGLGDRASWVPAGERDPNTGILLVKAGDVVLSLWLKLTTYTDETAARADSVELITEMLAALGFVLPEPSQTEAGPAMRLPAPSTVPRHPGGITAVASI